MSKNFELILGTTDAEGVAVTERVNVRVGSPNFDAPTVSFAFPPNVPVRQGNATGPFWPTSQYLGFAYCRVVPTPSGIGTGRFFVQHYYDGADFPNNPAFKFERTFDGDAANLVSSLGYNEVNEAFLTDAGGISPYGFATSGDLSGIRRALVLAEEDLSYVYTSTGGRGGTRIGFRNNGEDEYIAVWHHDQDDDKLLTLERLKRSTGRTALGRRVGALYSWASGVQILYHPYHYVPMYSNSGVTATTVEPHICAIEEGIQFPLTGYFTVSGTVVSGTFSRLTSEVSPGSQMAVRFTGDATWYLVSGVADDNSMTIWDYGENPYLTNVAAEAVPYAVGSGTITILPGLSGCYDWDIALTDYQDGDGVPNLSGVVFEAETVEISPGGAPSGSLTYTWEIQTLGSGTTTILGSGSQITVDYSTGTPKEVRVFVSGAGQPECVHSDATGFITLEEDIPNGIWYHQPSLMFNKPADTVTNVWSRGWWTTLGTWWYGYSDLYYHHQLYRFTPHKAQLNETWYPPSQNYISVKAGQIDNWPNAGTFVLAQRMGSSVRHIYGIYSGKQTGTIDDRLTGITIKGGFTCSSQYNLTSVTSTAGVSYVQPSEEDVILYVPVPGYFPFTFVEAKIDNYTLRIENGWMLSARSAGGGKVVLLGTDGSTNAFNMTISDPGGGTRKDVSFDSSIPPGIGEGSMVVMQPWDSDIAGNVESWDKKFWNRGNLCWMDSYDLYLDGAWGQNRWIDSTDNFKIRAVDRTKRNTTGTMGNFPRYTWLPPQGRLVFPQYDRDTTFVVSYQSYTETTTPGAGITQIDFENCRVVSVNGSPTSGLFRRYHYIMPMKELEFYPSPVIDTQPPDGSRPATEWIENIGITPQFIGLNEVWVDVVNINRSSENPNAVGSTGGRNSEPNWEEALWPSFPSNGMVSSDAIYRGFTDAVEEVPPPGVSPGALILLPEADMYNP